MVRRTRIEMSQIREQFSQLWRWLQQENLLWVMAWVAALLGAGSVAILFFEPGLSWEGALWWSIVTLTTVGYGVIGPETVGGRLVAAVLMVVGVGILGIFSATVASVLVDRRLKLGWGMSSFQFTDHIILCGWNHRAHVILREFAAEPVTAQAKIVVIADVPNKPIESDQVYFIRGEATDETLRRANLVQARTVVILSDERLDEQNRDARTVLTTLTVESINPQVYTIVELVDEKHVPYCRRAQANEIIVGSELASRLISRAVTNPGISRVVAELLSMEDQGLRLQRMLVPESLRGKPFIEVLSQIKQSHQSIVMAVQQEGGEMIANPAADYRLQSEDHLILMAPMQEHL